MVPKRWKVKVQVEDWYMFPNRWRTLGVIRGRQKSTRERQVKRLLKRHKWSYRNDTWKLVLVKGAK